MVGCMPAADDKRDKAVLALARERPEIGRVRAARELGERGIEVSPSRVQAIWTRHGLATPYARLMRCADGGVGTSALSEAQRDLLRRATISRRSRLRSRGRAESASHPRRDDLIASAARVFAAKGYDGASVREICAQAGILAGSMYRHFRSKEDLFVSVHAAGFRELRDVVQRALVDSDDPWQRLEAAIAAHLALLVSRGDVLAVTVGSLFRVARPSLQRRLNTEREAYERSFGDLVDALPLRPGLDRTLLRLTLLGAVNWARLWYRPGKKSPAEIAHHLVHETVRRGVGEIHLEDASSKDLVSARGSVRRRMLR
jgi:AcrR family transcriptional regulator